MRNEGEEKEKKEEEQGFRGHMAFSVNSVHRQNNSCFRKDDPACWKEEGLSRSAFKGRYFPLTIVVSQETACNGTW